MFTRIALLTLLGLGLAGPAFASLQVEAPEALQPKLERWVTEARVPSPPAWVYVVVGPCFDGQQVSCTAPEEDTIWFMPRDGRQGFLHEVGHRFDYLMGDYARRRFLFFTHQVDRPWRDAPNSPHEQFAEAWRLCADNPLRLTLNRSTAYNYDPTLRQHRRVCLLIQREAERRGWQG